MFNIGHVPRICCASAGCCDNISSQQRGGGETPSQECSEKKKKKIKIASLEQCIRQQNELCSRGRSFYWAITQRRETLKLFCGKIIPPGELGRAAGGAWQVYGDEASSSSGVSGTGRPQNSGNVHLEELRAWSWNCLPWKGQKALDVALGTPRWCWRISEGFSNLDHSMFLEQRISPEALSSPCPPQPFPFKSKPNFSGVFMAQ